MQAIVGGRTVRPPTLIVAGIAAVLLSAMVPVLAEALASRGGGLQPIGAAYGWETVLVAVHLITDTLIGLAYIAISVTLMVLARRARQDIPFLWAFVAFGVFIISCGMTHFMAAVTLWAPLYWIAASVKDITAVASVGTAVALPPLVPKVMALIQTAKMSEQRRLLLEDSNNELAALTTRLTEADALKTQFFASASHELRTPLTLILGPVDQLLRAGNLTPAQRRDLEVVARNGRTLLAHVNDLLDVAKVDAGEMTLAQVDSDLAWLVRGAAGHFDALAGERGIAFALDVPTVLPARVDAERLQRVVLNLLANAFRFTPAGGHIRCRLSAAGDRARLEVEDSGPGVPVEQREVIFEPYHQADGGLDHRLGGTGLGLAIVKQIVQLHHGTVGVEDSPMGGARFVVELPLIAPFGPERILPGRPETAAETLVGPLEPASAHPVDPPADREGREGAPLVLVVEDNPDMNRYISGILSEHYRTASAFDGAQGLAAALAQRPDLIITDVMMPAMSGNHLVKEIRCRPELDGIPIVVVTARAGETFGAEMLSAGAQDYLSKPFSAAELQARVGNWIASARTRQLLQRDLASRRMDLEQLAGEIIARRREAEAATQARDEFLSNAAHELKTPLTALLGNIELAERLILRAGVADSATGSNLARALQRARAPGVRLARLVDDLLDTGRIAARSLSLWVRVTDVAALAGDAVAEQRRLDPDRGIELRLPPAPIRSALIDADRIRQVLDNYLTNARKYAPPDRPIAVEVRGEAACVRVLVRDEGPGIPAEEQARIWDRSYQVEGIEPRSGSHIGLGLGLFISRTIVESHGGQVGVDSAPGQGATFWFTVPYGDVAADGSANGVPGPTGEQGGAA